jgi:hypothetical protein
MLVIVTLGATFVAAGWATSTLATTGGIAIPGTTITIPTDENGKPDIAGLILTEGITLPGGITLPKGFKVPEGFTVPEGLIPTTPTSPASPTTATSATPPASTTPPPVTTPGAVAPDVGQTPPVDPAQALSGLLGGGGTPTTTPAQVKPADNSGDAAATLLLVVIAALLLAIALALAVSRLLGWEPEWWSGRRHQTSEAAWRTSNTLADFGDWVRRKQ